MTIDSTYTVDTALALVDVDDLMTKAFHLTHQMHEQERAIKAALTPESVAHREGILAEHRAQRDAIVREMQRRSDGLERALVTVEATERVMRGVDETLASVDHSLRDPGYAVAIAEAREALDMAMERTTTISCTLVKDQTLSDRIAAAAREVVKPIKTRAREVGQSVREARR